MPAFSFFFILLSVTLLLAAGVILWRGRATLAASGLPKGAVVYADSERWQRLDKPLVDNQLRLSGKPDYVIETTAGMVIPVEIKSSPAPSEPYPGHLFQLAAYCLLVSRAFGVRPEYGIIQYADGGFEVDFTPDLEEDLLTILTDMRHDLASYDVDRSHEDWRRCQKCGVRGECRQRLG